ncbi:MAG: prolyl oligopeptidase family serine peptidase [Phycisphaerae bacterium]
MTRNVIFAAALLLSVAAAQADDVAYDIPRLDDIVIDGRTDDWAGDGFRIGVMPYRSLQELDDQFTTARIGWNDEGLLVLVVVRDDVLIGAPNNFFWSEDSVEIMVGTESGSEMWYQFCTAPGGDGTEAAGRCMYYEKRLHSETPLTGTAASNPTGEGYAVEILLPWSNLLVGPETGRAAVSIFVNDVDEVGGRLSQQFWTGRPQGGRGSESLQDVRLSEAAGVAPPLAASARYVNLVRTQIDIVGIGQLSGRKVQIRRGDEVLGTAVLEGSVGATASVTMPMPPQGRPYGELAVVVEDAQGVTVTPPDADAAREKAFRSEEVFVRSVFSGERLPTVDFEQPGWIETLLGPYDVTATYHDADYNEVSLAGSPGRYGAIVRIETESGLTREEHITLYRQPQSVHWSRWDDWQPAGGGDLPNWLGISREVIDSQQALLAEHAKWRTRDALQSDRGMAVLLAGLSEMSPDDPPVTDRTSPEQRDRRWWFGLRRKLGLGETKYLLHVPASYEEDGERHWPMIVYLHGAGARGDDPKRIQNAGLPRRLLTEEDFPFIVVSPLCPAGQWWLPVEIVTLMDEVIAEYRVDPDRVYLTGVSMGGFGSWQTAVAFPDRFAAVAPVCGGGDTAEAERIAELPIWAFHGAKDAVVPLELSENMIEAVRAAGGNPALTVYPDEGHAIQSLVYNDDRLYEWFLSNRRGERMSPPPSTMPAVPAGE